MSKNKFMDKIPADELNMREVNQAENVEDMLELETKKLLKAKQQRQMQDMRDTQYYAVVVFANQNDKDTFLNKIEVEAEGETYIDGYELAEKIGVKIEMTASLPDPHFVKQLKLKKNGIKIKR